MKEHYFKLPLLFLFTINFKMPSCAWVIAIKCYGLCNLELIWVHTIDLSKQSFHRVHWVVCFLFCLCERDGLFPFSQKTAANPKSCVERLNWNDTRATAIPLKHIRLLFKKQTEMSQIKHCKHKARFVCLYDIYHGVGYLQCLSIHYCISLL